MNRYFLAFLGAPRIIVLAACIMLVFALSIFWVQDQWTLDHSNTKRSIEFRIQNQVPAKATQDWVKNGSEVRDGAIKTQLKAVAKKNTMSFG